MLKLSKGQRVILAGLLILASLLTKQLQVWPDAADVLMVLAALLAGYPIALNAFRAIRYGVLGIDALVTLAVTGAIFIGEYWEAAAVTFLFMLGNYLEARTLEKTRSALKALLDLAPNTARVLRNGTEVTLEPNEVKQGEVVIIRPGEKIPVDGTVIEGRAYVNQAAITGEAMPVEVDSHCTVFSGTVLESGYLLVKAEQVGEDTTFSQILHLVEEAQDSKAKTQKFLERFAKYYTPGIIGLSVIVFALTRDLHLALTLLVIACPGALVIATPVSIVAGIGNGAKNGVLIKGGEIIENLAQVKALAFDKTGTLTMGSPKVVNIKAFFDYTEDEVIHLAASAEMYSEHPLARAIITEAGRKSSPALRKPEDSQITPGQGIKVTLEGKRVLVGNSKLITGNGLVIKDEISDYLLARETAGETAVLVAVENQVSGVIAIADTLRADAQNMIKQIKAQGINKVIMLTGDNRRAAATIAEKLGIDEYYAELLPEDKVTVLQRIQQEMGSVAMVGDGVNDAPALASADLGIAVGGAGKDVAMETADVVLLSSELKKLAYAIGLSRATNRNMKQNIYFAVLIVGLLVAGVLAKVVYLSSGMLIHELSVLAVIINAIRLLKYKDQIS